VPICGQGSGIIRADKAPLLVTFASAKLPASSNTEESRWCRNCRGIGTVSSSMLGALVLGVLNLPALADGVSGVVSSCHGALTSRSGVPVDSSCG
jgi:hypothetical protein